MTGPVGVEELDRFRAIVEHRLGLRFDTAEAPALVDALRLRLSGRDATCPGYLRWLELEAGPEEFQAVARELTNSETYFFREPAHFQALVDVVLPDRIRARGEDRQLAILSAGCASGEEAYSLAIRAREALPDRSWGISVTGIDINATLLEKAAVGLYSAWALRATPDDVRQRWFQPRDGAWLLNAEARTGVRFEQHNLGDGSANLWRSGQYDVIFCRNVLMYFTPQSASATVASFARALAPGGYLFLSSAETLRGGSPEFAPRQTDETFYYRLVDRPVRRPAARRPDPPAVRPPPPVPPSTPPVPDGDWFGVIDAATARIRALTLAARGGDPAGTAVGGESAVAREDLAAPLDMLRGDRFENALDALSSLSAGSGRDPDALLLRAVLLTQSGQLALAEEICHELLRRDESTAGAHFVIGSCRAGLDDPAAAVEHYRAATECDPQFSMPHLHHGLLARRAGNRELARREFETALTLLEREDASRLLLFGGGFSRAALIDLCRAELLALRATGSDGDAPRLDMAVRTW